MPSSHTYTHTHTARNCTSLRARENHTGYNSQHSRVSVQATLTSVRLGGTPLFTTTNFLCLHIIQRGRSREKREDGMTALYLGSMLSQPENAPCLHPNSGAKAPRHNG